MTKINYGKPMTAYKVYHGMSVQDALASIPDDMKTSGELQNQYMMNDNNKKPTLFLE